jgi:acetylornithine deacetylase/succinyl-diaminopimelate desuccinylase-like protein
MRLRHLRLRDLTLGCALAAMLAVGGLLARASAAELTPQQRAFREIYTELVEINTTDSVGDTVKSAEAMAARLRAGGIPPADIRVISSGPRKGNMVARLHRGAQADPPDRPYGRGRGEARGLGFRSFTLQEVDGFFRARGSIDDKAMASIFVANLIEYAKEGFKPDRDIILALTADEELSDSPHDGAHYLLDHYRDLIDAEFAINEGGQSALRDGKPFRMSVGHAEKVYQTYVLEVTDRGGHSASGRRDNAIYVMADALRRLGQFDFPVALTRLRAPSSNAWRRSRRAPWRKPSRRC